jgi:hypothetical protein
LVVGVEHHVRHVLVADEEIEARKRLAEHGGKQSGDAVGCLRAGGRGRDVGYTACHTVVFAVEEELHAVGELVVEIDLGDGGLDGDLKLRTINLGQGPRDDLVVLSARIDQQGVAGHIGCNPHALEHGLTAAARGAALKTACIALTLLPAKRAAGGPRGRPSAETTTAAEATTTATKAAGARATRAAGAAAAAAA